MANLHLHLSQCAQVDLDHFGLDEGEHIGGTTDNYRRDGRLIVVVEGQRQTEDIRRTTRGNGLQLAQLDGWGCAVSAGHEENCQDQRQRQVLPRHRRCTLPVPSQRDAFKRTGMPLFSALAIEPARCYHYRRQRVVLQPYAAEAGLKLAQPWLSVNASTCGSRSMVGKIHDGAFTDKRVTIM